MSALTPPTTPATAWWADDAVAIAAARDVTRRHGSGESAVDALAGVTVDLGRRARRRHGPLGLRQVDPHARHGRPRHADVRQRRGRRHRARHPRRRRLTRLRRDRVGFVFQAFNLLPTLSAAENVALPLRIAGRRVDRGQIAALLDSVGLADRAGHRPSQLSGGQQQRVAVARALVTRPDVVFADEPTGNLDSHASAAVLALLRDAADGRGQTIVMVTHDAHAASVADRVLFLVDGRLVRDSAPHRRRDPRRHEGAPVNRLALRGLATRKLRTVLTALARVRRRHGDRHPRARRDRQARLHRLYTSGTRRRRGRHRQLVVRTATAARRRRRSRRASSPRSAPCPAWPSPAARIEGQAQLIGPDGECSAATGLRSSAYSVPTPGSRASTSPPDAGRRRRGRDRRHRRRREPRHRRPRRRRDQPADRATASPASSGWATSARPARRSRSSTCRRRRRLRPARAGRRHPRGGRARRRDAELVRRLRRRELPRPTRCASRPAQNTRSHDA